MSRGPVARVEGLRELKASMRRAGVDMADLKAATAKAAATVADAARPRAPVRTGRLAGSIKGNRAVNRAVVGSRLVYGGPIHWGWPARHIQADPFIVDAAQATEPQWVGGYLQEVQHILDRVKGA